MSKAKGACRTGSLTGGLYMNHSPTPLFFSEGYVYSVSVWWKTRNQCLCVTANVNGWVFKLSLLLKKCKGWTVNELILLYNNVFIRHTSSIFVLIKKKKHKKSEETGPGKWWCLVSLMKSLCLCVPWILTTILIRI